MEYGRSDFQTTSYASISKILFQWTHRSKIRMTIDAVMEFNVKIAENSILFIQFTINHLT